MMTKNIFALIACFVIFNLHASDDQNVDLSMSPEITINITAEPITQQQAMIIFGRHAIQNPLELIQHLIADRFDDFIFTINGVTYMVQADNDLPVPNPSPTSVSVTITAHLVSPVKAAVIIAKAAALFFIENFTGDPAQFVHAILAKSHNGFIFTIDGITYIIQS